MVQIQQWYVLFLGFDQEQIKTFLNNSVVEKVVIFDTSDRNRKYFEILHNQFKNRVTMYEGCIPTNVDKYLQKCFDLVQFKWAGDVDLLNSCKAEFNEQNIHDSCLN